MSRILRLLCVAIAALSTYRSIHLSLSAFDSSEDTSLASPPVAVFYNVFLPAQDLDRALGIVEEQLQQVGSSRLIKEHPQETIYFTTIQRPMNASWMSHACTRAGIHSCKLLAHHEEAFEDAMLTELHAYCQREPLHSVVYLHSKGTFHARNERQANWRRRMTAAVTGPCELKDGCNACGLLFQSIPSEHFHGNMWRADCAYIRKLLAPRDFAEARLRTLEALSKEDSLGFYLCRDVDYNKGTGRYAWEHWLGSHPDIRPCDVAGNASAADWKSDEGKSPAMIWALFPHHDHIRDTNMPKPCRNRGRTVWTNQAMMDREWTLLPGKIYRWSREYNATPTHDSWIWRLYPGGVDARRGLP